MAQRKSCDAEKSQRDKETKSQRDKVSKGRRDEERKRQREEETEGEGRKAKEPFFETLMFMN